MAKTNAKPAAKTTAVAVKPPAGEVAVPSYIRQGAAARGAENVGMEDLVIPRLLVLQDGSPMLKRSDPKYNDEADVGMLTNSVTGELYGDALHVVPVFYTKQYLVWRKKENGGGFLGAFNSQVEAEGRVKQEQNKQGLEIVDTPQHLCLLIKDGKTEEIMLSLPRTKAKVSRQWNSMAKLAGGDLFSRVYKVTTAEETNTKGTFYNFVIAPIGFAPEHAYRAAEALYEKVSSGQRRVVMDVSDEGHEDGDDSGM